VIEIRELSKTYLTRDGERIHALDRITLSVAPNEFVALVGASGCGKSTLLKIVAGLIPWDSGVALVNGRPVGGPRPDVGLMFQTSVLVPWRDVLDNVLLSVELLGRPRAAYLDAARQLLEMVGLAGFAHKRPTELSGGMQQRVALCRALVNDPALLLMDEPFAALDAITRDELGLELLRIWEERRKTVLFVTHGINEAVMLADRVVVMTPRPGTIAAEFPIALPRPRPPEMEYSPQFVEYVHAIKDTIFGRGRAPAGRGAGERLVAP
jgi:NitT/TauT family transport system ATP-binding protein